MRFNRGALFATQLSVEKQRQPATYFVTLNQTAHPIL
jgi:hypothetical protein